MPYIGIDLQYFDKTATQNKFQLYTIIMNNNQELIIAVINNLTKRRNNYD